MEGRRYARRTAAAVTAAESVAEKSREANSMALQEYTREGTKGVNSIIGAPMPRRDDFLSNFNQTANATSRIGAKFGEFYLPLLHPGHYQ